MRNADYQRLEAVASVTNLPAPGQPAVPDVNVRLAQAFDTLTNVPDYLATAGQHPGMRNEPLRLTLLNLQSLVASQGTLLATLAGRADASDLKVAAQAAQLQLAQASYQQLLTSQQADEARLALVEAKAALTASATEANRLDIVALKAADVALQARASQDEAAIVAAQATATQARQEAAAAQAKADADATAAQQAMTAAITAQATATQATTALAVLSGRIKMQRVAVPAIGVGQTATITATWPTAFGDADYQVVCELEGAALLGLDPGVTTRTASQATAQLKNSLGLGITAGSGFITFTAIHV